MFKPILKFSLFFIAFILLPLQNTLTQTPIQNNRATKLARVQKSIEKPAINFDYGKIPLYFIPNEGQVDRKALFYAKSSNYTLWVMKEGLVFDSIMRKGSSKRTKLNTDKQNHGIPSSQKYKRDISRLIFLNAKQNSEVFPFENTKHRINYIIGDDESKWKADIPASSAILYKELYKNVDLKIHGIEKQVEYDFIIKPGGKVSDIKISYQNIKTTRINEKGSLVIETEFGKLTHAQPVCYQVIDKKKIKIKCEFKEVNANTYSFEVEEYNIHHNLIIDPLVYATYIGGTSSDWIASIAVNKQGETYITGYTDGYDFPTENPVLSKKPWQNAFITKINQSGNALIFSTYLGGSESDYGNGIAVDKNDSVYVIGSTDSTNFPTQNPLQVNNAGMVDVFLTKLNSKGNVVLYSTYLGGSEDDNGFGIAVDEKGSAHLTGKTRSSNFPTKSAFQKIKAGGFDTFVVKINSKGKALVYSTFLGGTSTDYGLGIAVDNKGEAYISGITASGDFPTKGAIQENFGGQWDAFISKINKKGNKLVYSTYLGGSSKDSGVDIGLNKRNEVIVAGPTESGNFPTKNPIQANYAGNSDAFIAKINKKGKALVYSTYLGGSAYEEVFGLAVNKRGEVYVTGPTQSEDFPIKNPIQANLSGWRDIFITKINKTGKAVVYSTYLGGLEDEKGTCIAVDNKMAAYVGGNTYSTDFPTKNPFQANNAGEYDGFIVKLK